MSTEILPLVAKAGRMAEQSQEIALAIKIDSPEMFEIAGSELRDIVTRRSQAEELRLSMTRPLDTSKQRIIDLFRPHMDRLAQAAQLLRTGMTTYQREEAEKAAKAQREADAQAEADREEQERVRKAAEADRIKAEDAAEAARFAGDTEGAEAANVKAMQASATADEAAAQIDLADIAPPTSVSVIRPKANGISSRKNWKAEVTDFKALVLEAADRAKNGDDFLLGYLEPNAKAINNAAKSMQKKLVLAGVRVYAEDVLAARRRP